MADYDRAAAGRRRVERHRAARVMRRRRWLVAGGIFLALAAVAGAAYGGWRLVTGGARTAEAERPAPAPATVPTAALEPTASVEPSATAGATETVKASASPTITVIGVGDLLFDLSPRRLIAAQGGRAPLAKVENLLADADVTIGNLEGPLSNRGTHVGGKTPNLIFEGDPRAVQGLTASGFDFVALANNHVMDHGGIALQDTLGTLDKAGIAHAGAGMNAAAAWEPAIVERNGRRIAYLSFSQVVPSGFTPGPSRPGMAVGKDMAKVTSAIRAAKQRADYVIVSFHWGVEQSYSMNSAQVRDARRSIDAGADMVLSHHPHVMQGIEFYKGKLIAYSLGNFIFPYKTVEGRKSIVLKASLGPAGVTDVTAVPVYLGEWGRPVPQTGRSAAGILGKLKAISAPRGTRVVIDGDSAKVLPK